jgi:hypothetical protein
VESFACKKGRVSSPSEKRRPRKIPGKETFEDGVRENMATKTPHSLGMSVLFGFFALLSLAACANAVLG